MRRLALLAGVWALGLAAACSRQAPAEPPRPRTLTEARQQVLKLFQQLDGFELEKQLDASLAGRPAVRMEAGWRHDGERRRGIIYVLDHPALFNVIHFTTPSEGDLFEQGYKVFEGVFKALRVVQPPGALTVSEEQGQKVLRSPELQLEIRYPLDWVYSLDELNRALVLSGPRDQPTWLTTISFSVLEKWESAAP
jgi:hypothetical protein